MLLEEFLYGSDKVSSLPEVEETLQRQGPLVWRGWGCLGSVFCFVLF